MAELLLSGRGRVAPASSYADPSLGRARVDDEARVSAFIDPADAHRFYAVVRDGVREFAADVEVPYLGSVPIEVECNTDYYVYCMAEDVEARRFEDFDADTCVVITDVERFKARLEASMRERLPGWGCHSSPVVYYDPFFCATDKIIPHFWKHFRYSYQKEHRFVWIPPSISWSEKLEPVWFELGPLTDCAKLVWL